MKIIYPIPMTAMALIKNKGEEKMKRHADNKIFIAA